MSHAAEPRGRGEDPEPGTPGQTRYVADVCTSCLAVRAHRVVAAGRAQGNQLKECTVCLTRTLFDREKYTARLAEGDWSDLADLRSRTRPSLDTEAVDTIARSILPEPARTSLAAGALARNLPVRLPLGGVGWLWAGFVLLVGAGVLAVAVSDGIGVGALIAGAGLLVFCWSQWRARVVRRRVVPLADGLLAAFQAEPGTLLAAFGETRGARTVRRFLVEHYGLGRIPAVPVWWLLLCLGVGLGLAYLEEPGRRELRWRWACVQNTTSAYAGFASSCSESLHVQDARKRLGDLAFEEARRMGAAALKRYAAKTPPGWHAEEARQLAPQLAVEEARTGRSLDPWLALCREFPTHPAIAEARAVLRQRLMPEGIEGRAAARFEQYLELFPDGDQAAVARKWLDDLDYEHATRTGRLAALLAYAAKHPQGARSADIAARAEKAVLDKAAWLRSRDLPAEAAPCVLLDALARHVRAGGGGAVAVEIERTAEAVERLLRAGASLGAVASPDVAIRQFNERNLGVPVNGVFQRFLDRHFGSGTFTVGSSARPGTAPVARVRLALCPTGGVFRSEASGSPGGPRGFASPLYGERTGYMGLRILWSVAFLGGPSFPAEHRVEPPLRFSLRPGQNAYPEMIGALLYGFESQFAKFLAEP